MQENDEARVDALLHIIVRDISHEMRSSRLRLGLSQEDVALAAGLAVVTYGQFERHRLPPAPPLNPKLRTLVRIADVLGARVRFVIEPDSPTP